ncbi:MAG TPA: glycosyltransferase family 39 protein [Kiritimatiellia bacterium]|nr:glycosyltransferase family 39 protein [Kiritimatiellia bacterium]
MKPPPKNFEAIIQDLVYNVDVGIGLKLVKTGLYLLLVLGLVSIYTATQFHGLNNAQAMDYAQLGRNIAHLGTFQTQVIRPAALHHLTEKKGDSPEWMRNHPDIVNPPLYPLTLAAGFSLVGDSYPRDQSFKVIPPEQYVIIPLNLLFSLLTGLFLYFTAKRFFDPRIALIGVSLFFLSDSVWATSITGLPTSLVTFLAILMFRFMLIAHERYAESTTFRHWAFPAAAAALCAGLAILTRYAAWPLLAGIILWIAVQFRGPALPKALALVLAIVAILLAPWIARNLSVSGAPFGMTPKLANNDTELLVTRSYERALYPEPAGTAALRNKWLAGLESLYAQPFRTIGDGVLIGLFFTTFFFRFVRDSIRVMRWTLLLALALLLNISALYTSDDSTLLQIFWPFVILYGLSFYFILIDRLQITIPLVRWSVHAALITATSLPLLFTLLPPRAAHPYPPYDPAVISFVSQKLNPDELLCTDIPWATAWYGNRNSILLPKEMREFYDIHDLRRRISGLYFTTETRDLPFARTLLTGPFRSWWPVFQLRIPGDFPLKEAVFLYNQDQLFLTDRPR